MRNKVDPESESMDGYYQDGTRIKYRMKPEWDHTVFKSREAASEGKMVQLVVRPGVVLRGCTLYEDYSFDGRRKLISFYDDWKIISWFRPMLVVVPESFNLPIE